MKKYTTEMNVQGIQFCSPKIVAYNYITLRQNYPAVKKLSH